jgi:hypothetical protein
MSSGLQGRAIRDEKDPVENDQRHDCDSAIRGHGSQTLRFGKPPTEQNAPHEIAAHSPWNTGVHKTPRPTQSPNRLERNLISFDENPPPKKSHNAGRDEERRPNRKHDERFRI